MNWRRAHQFGRMVAMHLYHGRFTAAHNSIVWAEHESAEPSELLTLASPIAALNLPIWVAEQCERHELIYIFQLVDYGRKQIAAWQTDDGRNNGRQALRVLSRKLSQHGLRVWKQQQPTT